MKNSPRVIFFQRFSVGLAALAVLPALRAQPPPVAPSPAIVPPPNLAVPPIPPPVTRPQLLAERSGPPPIPKTPWYGNLPLPSDDELKVLTAAREAAEKDREVMIASRTYAERFGAADDLIRTLIFANPALQDPAYEQYLPLLKLNQVLHENNWDIGLDNNPDMLLPDPTASGPWGSGIIISMSSSSGGYLYRLSLEQALEHTRDVASTRTTYGLRDIRQAALDNPDAKAALLKTRAAFQALSAAVRSAMAKDPAAKALIEKYPYLLYGRHDLGFKVAMAMIMT